MNSCTFYHEYTHDENFRLCFKFYHERRHILQQTYKKNHTFMTVILFGVHIKLTLFVWPITFKLKITELLSMLLILNRKSCTEWAKSHFTLLKANKKKGIRPKKSVT